MKTAILSDIHIDINEEYDVLDAIAEYLRDNAIELLLLAGDISNSVDATIEAVRELEEISGVTVRYIPGNHDMWDEKASFENNDQIYAKYLADERCLCGKSFETDAFFIVGDIGWYDYSFGNQEKHTHDEFETMSYNGRTMQDKLFNCWTSDNEGRCRWFAERMQAQIDKNPGKKLVIMTHMLSHEAFRVPESREGWSFFNAFMGSFALKELCLKNHAAYAVCGHIHYRSSVTESGTTWLCRCLNYCTEWRGEKDVRKQLAESFAVIEL